MIVNTLAPPTTSPLNPTKVNLATIPNLNRLSAMLMSVDEGEGNEQDIAVLAPVGNTLENRLKIILSLVIIS